MLVVNMLVVRMLVVRMNNSTLHASIAEVTGDTRQMKVSIILVALSRKQFCPEASPIDQTLCDSQFLQYHPPKEMEMRWRFLLGVLQTE